MLLIRNGYFHLNFIMEFAFVTVPAAPVRRKPRHKAEMVNQLLYGEAVKILKTREANWIKVRSLHDDYEGWLTWHMIRPATKDQVRHRKTMMTAGLLAAIEVNGSTMFIPAGSRLADPASGEDEYSFSGVTIDPSAETPSSGRLTELAMAWLNAPYLWGGRTVLGIDCSGFVQVVYGMIGISLPRDAWQQAQEGHQVKKIKDALTGDLAFFDDKDEIVHVGILLGNDRIIHASGKVRIDGIDKEGIVHAETGKRTHRLRAIRRFW